MKAITKVSAQKRRGRYNIFLDNNYAFSVSEKTLTKFVLLQGKELSPQQIERIKLYDADAKASNLAARYLGYEPRTVYEVLTYLQKHGVSEKAAAAAVKELSSLGYLDDRQYCKLFIKNDLRVGKDGPKKLAGKLRQKGIASELSAEELAQVDEADWLSVGAKVIKTSLSQQGKISRRELKRKMMTKLLSHGFSGDLASAVIAQSLPAQSEEEEQEALKRQGIKAYKRFRRLPSQKRRFKIRHYLYGHGFSSGEIDAFLDGELVPLSDLEEY